MKMAAGMRASGEGVVVLSCSDPRLNPYQILGLDSTLSKHYPCRQHVLVPRLTELAFYSDLGKLTSEISRGDHGQECRRQGIRRY